MSATVVERRTTAAALPGQLRRTFVFLVYGVRQMLFGYWLIMLVGFTTVGVVIHLVTGTLDESVWDYAAQSPKYFNASIGVMLTPAFLTLLVAHGVTRRTFAIAGTLLLTLNAAGNALLWVVVYLLERGLFDWRGWPQEMNNPHLFTSTSQSQLVFTEFFLLVLAHEVAGWLIATAFVRYRFWGGLALLPLNLLPAVATELLLLSGWVAQALGDLGLERPPLGVAVPAVLAICALGIYLNYLVLRGIGLRPPRS
jgi:hypothetical protein